MKKLICVFLLLMSGSVQAATVTLDFEEFTGTETGTLQTQGYTISPGGQGSTPEATGSVHIGTTGT
ncbi:MAG: hypothetical protein ACR2QU_03295, partial [Gammaproteobacteria bacterium]